MPLMDLTFPAGALAEDARAALTDELTTVMLRAERAPDTPFFREITWLHLHELPARDALAAGAPVDGPMFVLQATVPEGALSERRKAEYVAEATRAIRTAAGIADEHALRVWVLIREVPDGSWGAGGQVIRFAQLREAAAAERAAAGAA